MLPPDKGKPFEKMGRKATAYVHYEQGSGAAGDGHMNNDTVHLPVQPS
jgi:hypothetical protein